VSSNTSDDEPKYPCRTSVDSPIVSIQGVKGSFHHITGELLFGPGITYLERDTFDQVFDDCASGRAQYALVAIENSIAGSLLQNYDLLAKNDLHIIGEALLRIEHHLIAHPGASLDSIKQVWSHPMAINQSQAFLDQLGIEVIEKRDTAGAVKYIKDEGLKDMAAIASDRSAELYGMNILRPNIETDPHNYTRFLLMSRHQSIETAEDLSYKTTLHLSVLEEPGSLAKLLQLIADKEINMTMIESRPQLGKPWQYDFFIDLQVRIDDPDNDAFIDEIRERTLFLEILGSYPCLGYLKT